MISSQQGHCLTASFFAEAEGVWIHDINRDSKSSFGYIDELKLTLFEQTPPWSWAIGFGYLPSPLERESNALKSFGILEAFAKKSWTTSYLQIGVDEIEYYESHQDQFLRTTDLLYFTTQPSPLFRFKHTAFDFIVFDKDFEQISEKGFKGYSALTTRQFSQNRVTISYLHGNSILESVKQTRFQVTHNTKDWETHLNISATHSQGESGPARHGSSTSILAVKTKESYRHLFAIERYRSENLSALPIEFSIRLGMDKKWHSGLSSRGELSYKKLDYEDSKDFEEYQARLVIGYTNSFLEL